MSFCNSFDVKKKKKKKKKASLLEITHHTGLYNTGTLHIMAILIVKGCISFDKIEYIVILC